MQSAVGAGAITAGHARALIALEGAAAQEHGLKVVLGRRLSVRQTEKRVAAMLEGPQLRHEKRRDPFTRDAEEKLSRRLSTRVHIVRRRRGGKIEIMFGSEEELIRLYERLSGKG